MRHKLVPFLLLLALAGGAAWLARPYWQGRQAAQAHALLLSGTVEATQLRPAFRVPGRIRRMPVEEGQRVEAGQLLAELDDASLRAAVQAARALRDAAAASLARLEAGSRPEEIRAAEAAVQEAQARLALARIERRRLEGLVPRKLAPPEALDRARSAEQVARAALAGARERLALLRAGPRQEDIRKARALLAAREAELAQAKLRLGYARLEAPAAGVVALRLHEPGEVVAAGQPVLELDLMDRPWVRAYLSERDLPRVRLGQQAEVRADGLPGLSLQGRLAFISPRAEYTPKTVETRELRVDLVYRIKVLVQDPEHRLKLGMPVDLRLPLTPP